MIIKKFQAKTEREAVELAKKELGEGVVVMNAKEVKQKGFFSFFKSPLMEVTVALEEESERPPAVFAPKKETSAPIVPDSIWEKEEALREEAQKEDTGKAIEQKLENLQSLLEQRIRQEEERPREEEEEVKESKFSKEIMTFMKLLYNTMIDNEVRDIYADQIIEEIEKIATSNMQLDFALSTVYQKMILKLGQPELITEGEKKPKTIFFVGPTGVGKTTTIAKIASKFCVEEKKKVALLTADTYRIAAAEQLRTYANILEVPFRIIYTSEEVAQAIEEFKGYDYILVDTAGHSHHNAEQKNMTKELLKSTEDRADQEVYLVLSATTKYRDLQKIADSYKEITDYKLIFTKLDETTALGNLFNLKLYTGASLSYVTCGQNVPDDIQAFNPQSTVKQILSSND
ncbi:MAG: flagellar biosynthesis protein FlhF [Lachnospiraceae bacterium]|nr:flagellar biosynthesis protein FlhF [Lachnospiraceae bacterium]